MKWWCVDLHRNGQSEFLGRVEATREEIDAYLGPYITVEGNHVVVFAKPTGAGQP